MEMPRTNKVTETEKEQGKEKEKEHGSRKEQ